MKAKEHNLDLPDLPFPGIDPFSYAERNVFFAREQQSRALIRRVVIHRGVLLYSDSGTGKSSLINAGLLPQAIAEGFQPERLRVQPRQDEEIIIERLSETARAGPPYLPSIFSANDDEERVVLQVASFLQTVKKKAPSARPLLIFDQFEEWFTLFEEGAKRKRVGEAQAAQDNIRDAILSLLLDTELPVKILLVLREDYLAKLTPFFQRYPNLPDHYLRLTALKGPEVKRIIRGPFEDNPGHYEPEISTALAQKIRKVFEGPSGSEPVRLSEVQIVCRTLYESGKTGDELEAYFDQHGGVQGILEEYLRQALESLPKKQRDPAIGLLSRMVTEAGTRNVISREDVISRVENEDNISSNILRKTLDSLEQETKLVRRERRREVYYYEISSEFLVAWIRTEAKERAERLRVKETELALQKQKKEAERQAKIASRLRRLTRGLIAACIVAAALFAIGVALWGIAKSERIKAEDARDKEQIAKNDAEIANINAQIAKDDAEIANINAQIAKVDAEIANIESQIAKVDAERANKNAQIAQAAAEKAKEEAKQWRLSTVSVVLSGNALRAKELGNTVQAALLARQAYNFNLKNMKKNLQRQVFLDPVYGALRETLNALPDTLGDPNKNGGPDKIEKHQDWARSIAISRNGIVASGGADGTILLWEFSKNTTESVELRGHSLSVRSLAFSPNGQKLASCGDDGRLLFWSVTDSGELTKLDTLIENKKSLWDVSFSPNSNWLAAAGADSTVFLFQFDRSIQQYRMDANNSILRRHKGRIRSLAFSPQSHLLASAGDDSLVYIWNLHSQSAKHRQLERKSPVRAIAFHPVADSTTIVGGDENGSLWRWDYLKSDVDTLGRHGDRVNAIAFESLSDRAKDSPLLATAGADGSVQLWNLEYWKNGPIMLREHAGWVWSVAFSPDGNKLLSGGSDKTVRIWTTSLDILSDRVCDRVKRNLTPSEWGNFIGEKSDYECTCPNLHPPSKDVTTSGEKETVTISRK